MLKNIYYELENDVPEMNFDSIPSIDGTWLIIIKRAAAEMYPVITVREINLTIYDTFRNPATQRIKPVQIKTLGITESADVSSFGLLLSFRGKRKFKWKERPWHLLALM